MSKEERDIELSLKGADTEQDLIGRRGSDNLTEINLTEENNESIVSIDNDKISKNDKKKDKKSKKEKDDKNAKEQSKEELKTVSYFSLYRFATKWDLFLMFVGILCSMAHGALSPMFTVLFGDVINTFDADTVIDSSVILDEISKAAIWFVILGGIALVVSYLQIACLLTAAQNQAKRMRLLYFQSLLRQEMGWYDNIDSGELTSRISSDVAKVEQGIADKVGSFTQYMAMCLVGFIIGFVKGWKLTLVIVSVSPLLIAAGAVMGVIISKASVEGQEAYSKADAVAQEVFGMIRTVVAFSAEDVEVERYKNKLQGAYKTGVKSSFAAGIGMGLTMLIIILIYALGFWVGYKFVNDGEIQPGDVLTVFFSVIIGAMGIGQAAPNLTAMATAQGAAYFIFEVIGREPAIDSLSGEGLVPEDCKGEVKFSNVEFHYGNEKKDGKLVLDSMEFSLKSGETLALIGHSGCGKSTTIQLVENFYYPTNGSVTLDGNEMKSLNIQWLRSQIGFVSQMPTLFATSISDNIALGAGYELNRNFDPSLEEGLDNLRFVQKEVTQEMVIEAAKKSNAHNFIMKMPDGYDTMVGPRGAQLSGGQKQRIAIARALIRNPKVLLLDEATSALDSESERIVQDALEKASEGRTTIVIAHRLSTIKNAHTIAVVDKGKIVESGPHAELLAQNGIYKEMLELQKLHAEEDDGTNTRSLDLLVCSDDDMIPDSRKVSTKSRNSYKELSDKEEENNDDEGEEKNANTVNADDVGFDVILRALKFNSPEWPYIVLGLIGNIVAGLVWPAFAFILSEVIGVLITGTQEEINKWTFVFIGLSVVAGFANFLAKWAPGVAGEKLTLRMRVLCFEALIHQPVYWYDYPDHSLGIITARLSSDASQVRNLTSESVGIMVNQCATLICGLAIAFYACPKLAAVVLCTLPVLVVASAAQMKLMSGFLEDGAKVYEKAGKVATEAVDNIRTVCALNGGYYFYKKYYDYVLEPSKGNFKNTQIAAISFGFSEMFMFLIWALAFWYGAVLVTDGYCTFTDMMKAITAIIFGAITAGQISAQAPDFAAGKIAAVNVFKFLDLQSDIDARDKSGLTPDSCDGDIEFSEIKFHYPTRPNVEVLKNLCGKVGNGQTLALVGESGCGKSTLISLTERFYNTAAGCVKLDGKAATDYNLSWLRNQIGIVSQEPDLFNATVRENIAYGFQKLETTVVTDEQIEWAAKKANAHDFIMELPLGYDNPVGERGSLLSGGQKQRVAIARALVRNPKVLLLDEATSALDSESERIVQAALDEASKGRTTIVIAHRLSTIQTADIICVVGNGVIIESGTHFDLIAKGGAYANLVNSQNGAVL